MPRVHFWFAVLVAFWDSSRLWWRRGMMRRRRRRRAGRPSQRRRTRPWPRRSRAERSRRGRKHSPTRTNSRRSPKGISQKYRPRRQPAGKPVSFIRDVAPILVENCIACHNPRKSESKYVMTTFTQLAKGGQQGEGITLEPGKPDESNLVELIRPDGKPRMPYKQDPLPAGEDRHDRAMGRRGGQVRRRLARRGLDRRAAQEPAGHDSGGLSRDRADHGAGIQPRRLDDRRIRLS